MDTSVVLRMHIMSYIIAHTCLFKKREFIIFLRLWSYFEVAFRLCYGVLVSRIVTGALIQPEHPGLCPMPTVACLLTSVQKANRGGCLHPCHLYLFTSSWYRLTYVLSALAQTTRHDLETLYKNVVLRMCWILSLVFWYLKTNFLVHRQLCIPLKDQSLDGPKRNDSSLLSGLHSVVNTRCEENGIFTA
jgi:hypothetical protein